MKKGKRQLWEEGSQESSVPLYSCTVPESKGIKSQNLGTRDSRPGVFSLPCTGTLEESDWREARSGLRPWKERV